MKKVKVQLGAKWNQLQWSKHKDRQQYHIPSSASYRQKSVCLWVSKLSLNEWNLSSSKQGFMFSI
jgi:hypothetical protein